MTNGMRVAVVGLWHLGTVAAACLSAFGHRVVGIDPNPEIVANLKKGTPLIFEPGLSELVNEGIGRGSLTFTTDIKSGVDCADAVMIAFDTPVRDDDTSDLTPILGSIGVMTDHLNEGCLLVISSQVPVGTCDKIKEMLTKSRPSLHFGIACVPENLKLSDAIARYKAPDFLVIGADTTEASEKARRLYWFVNADVVKTDLKTAETVKHAINSFLACQISFTNELGNICDLYGVDMLRIADVMKLDPRIGKDAFLRPGLGFSGGTLARDVTVLRGLGQMHSTETVMLDAIIRVNERQKKIVVERLSAIFGRLDGLSVGVLGLTYKPGTSTLRRSLALEIIKNLCQKGVVIKAYDPKADFTEMHLNANFEKCEDAAAAVDEVDALVILTGWPEFKEIDYKRLKLKMRHPVIIDTANMLDAEALEGLGFIYSGIGRGQVGVMGMAKSDRDAWKDTK